MHRKLVPKLIFTLLLVGTLSSAINVKPAKGEWTGTVYIKADGSIEPSNAPIITYDNTTYTFTNDINGSIVIERNYIILDGAGHTLHGSGTNQGISSSSAVYVTIRNMHITGFKRAIDICNRAGFWVITNNTITNNTVGIAMYYLTHNNTIAENYIANNNNTGIYISMDSTCNKVSNNTIIGSTFGIYLSTTFGTGHNTIIGNNIVNNKYGVFIYNSNNDGFYHNNFILNTVQVYISNATSAWDNGREGNYWSDYNGTDLDSNGVGDAPYIIDEKNIDHYPLMEPWASPWRDWSHYHNYSEIVNILLYLNQTYPNLVEVYSIGKSWQGRDIYCIRITNESNTKHKPKILFVGYHHARELISAELPLYFVVKAVISFGSNKTITHMLNYSEIYVIPALNVDGFNIVEQNEWQRKNAHPYDDDGDGLLDEDPPEDEDGDGYIEDLFFWNGTHYEFIRWEGIDNDGDGLYNEDWIGGVDLNRNYGYQWNASVQSGSPYPQDEDYRGPAAFSELETQAFRDFVLQHNFKYAISFHSGEECVVYPWGYTTEPPPDEQTFIDIASKIAEIAGVWYGQSGDWYTTSGVWDDWMYGNRGTLAFTCEIYKNSDAWQYEPGPYPNTWWEKGVFQYFNPDPSNIETVIQRWLPVFTYLTERAIEEECYHNVAITEIATLKNIVGQGYSINVNVTIANLGIFTENLNVTVYANMTTIETKQITLDSDTSLTLTFTWNISGSIKGNYTLWAYIHPVPGETYLDDNIFVYGWILVSIPGDVVEPYFEVDIYDITAICLCYGSEMGDPDYYADCDVDGNGIIDIYDLVTACINYGQKIHNP